MKRVVTHLDTPTRGKTAVGKPRNRWWDRLPDFITLFWKMLE